MDVAVDIAEDSASVAVIHRPVRWPVRKLADSYAYIDAFDQVNYPTQKQCLDSSLRVTIQLVGDTGHDMYWAKQNWCGYYQFTCGLALISGAASSASSISSRIRRASSTYRNPASVGRT
jgi:hypothetical protein